MNKISKSNREWGKILSPAVFDIMRMKGTEKPFSGAYANHHESGIYQCASCGLPLFVSDTKFDSGSGWPSFFSPVDEEHVETKSDKSHSMNRTEVRCARCGGHLGHVFNDGPEPTGMRYCINSVSLDFIAEK